MQPVPAERQPDRHRARPFDEDENPTTFTPDVIISPAPEGEVTLPETSQTDASDTFIYPPNPGNDLAGWMYLNLDHGSPLVRLIR